jgi:hypothetical protein
VTASHPTLGRYILSAGPGPDGQIPEALFTENESNLLRLYGVKASETNYSKDAFHRYLVNKELSAVNPCKEGTKVALPYVMEVALGVSEVLRLRLCREGSAAEVPDSEERVFTDRIDEADVFYAEKIPETVFSAETVTGAARSGSQ